MLSQACSELSIVSEPLNDLGVRLEWLVDVVGVQDVFSHLFLWCAMVTLFQDLLSRHDVLLQHLSKENVVDFDEMCGHALLQETWWEHHIVAVEPEFDAILRVEGGSFPRVSHSATSENASSCETIDPQTAVVDWTIAIGEETRANRPHDSPHAERVHPHPVDNAEGTVKRMRAVLSLTHLDGFEESADGT